MNFGRTLRTRINSYTFSHIAITALLIGNTAHAGMLDTYSCDPNANNGLIADLPGSESRVMSMAYHRVRTDTNSDGNIDQNDGFEGKEYLLESMHGSSATPCRLKIWDITNPSNPQEVDYYPKAEDGADATYFCGHHNFVGMGDKLAWSFTGHHQMDLNSSLVDGNFTASESLARTFNEDGSVMNMGSTDAFMVPVPGRHIEQLTFYPYAFGGVPHGYGYEPQTFLTIHDLRLSTPSITTQIDLPTNPDDSWDMDSTKVGQIPWSSVGFQGRVNMIGDLLIVRGDHETPRGVAIYDIKDPSNPTFLDSITTRNDGSDLGKAYDIMGMWKHFIILAINEDSGASIATRGLDIIDFSNPSNLQHVHFNDMSNRQQWGHSTRYPQFKDDYMFLGDAKVDMSPLLSGGNPTVVKSFNDGDSDVWDGSDAYGSELLPVGNLLISSSNLSQGSSKIWCNEATPDTTAPTVAYHYPADGATSLHIKSRVGVLIHEAFDYSTVNDSSFQILDSTNNPIPVDVSWMDNNTINITPKSDLSWDSTYTVKIPTGGFHDIAGNDLDSEYSFSFSTGANPNPAPIINNANLDNAISSIGQLNTITISATDAGDTLEYQVDWGDGSESAWTSSTSIAHSYSNSGIFSASVRVRDSSGSIASASLNLVVQPANHSASKSSSSIVVDDATNHVWNVNPDNNSVTKTNLTTGIKVNDFAVGNDPRGVAKNPETGNFLVTNYDEGTVTVLSESGTLVKTIDLGNPGSQPFAIITSSVTGYAYVSARAEGVIYRINLKDDTATSAVNEAETVKDKLYVGPTPYAMALSADESTLLVTRLISPENEGQVYRLNVGANVFNLHSVISIVEDTLPINTNTFAPGVPNYLMAIAIQPDGNTVWVGSKKDNVRRGASPLNNNDVGNNFENTVRSIISKISLSSNQEIAGSKTDIDNRELISDIKFGAGGNIAYVTHQGNNEITAFNVNNMQVLDRYTVGAAPLGIALQNENIYIHSFLAREVSFLNIFTGESNSFDLFETIHPATRTVDVANELMLTNVLEGKKLFYSASDSRISAEGYISCSACHLDGGSDERVWDFTDRGEGLRNTISLVGRAGTGHGRVHWSANFDEIHDFEHDIRGPFGGAGLMAESDFSTSNTTLGNTKAGKSVDLDNLAAYVTSLNAFPTSPHRNADGTLSTNVDLDGDGIKDNADGVKGKTIFQNLNCSGCHGGDEFTDSNTRKRHDVGTLDLNSGGRLGGNLLYGIDTPTLRHLWASAPYLHNGSAANIVDVLNNAKHGGTDTLNASDRNDLAAYLLQIDGIETVVAANNDDMQITSFDHQASVTTNTIDLELTAPNPMFTINNVQWVINDQNYSTPVSTSPWTKSWTPSGGTYRVYAMVTYNNGVVTLSQENTVTIAANDVDNDGVLDSNDNCYTPGYTANGMPVDTNGCYQFIDSDNDNVPDYRDLCENTATNATVDIDGCATASSPSILGNYGTYTPNGSVTENNGTYTMTVNNVATNNPWFVQLTIAANITSGTEYTLCFDAYASSNRDIDFTIESGDPDYIAMGPQAPSFKALTTISQSFSHTWTADRTDATSRVAFNIANEAPTITLSNVKLVEGSTCVSGVSDADHDGVEDSIDQCSNSTAGELVDATGCSYGDADSDGKPDNEDYCPNTAANAQVDSFGCELPDTDGDGVYDINDTCANTPSNVQVDSNGCELPDSDNDGIYDINDNCPNDPSAGNLNPDGDSLCNENDDDDDGDGVTDDTDQCPNTAAGVSVNGIGCPATTFDTTIEAESFDNMQGVQTEGCTDNTGCGDNVSYIDGGDWMTYSSINIPEAGTYTVEFRVAGNAGDNKQITFERAGGSEQFVTATMNSTNGWQNWTTITVTTVLPAGSLKPAIATSTGGFNINWFRIYK